jgi:hypothetical protein
LAEALAVNWPGDRMKRQEIKEINGVIKRVCPICREVIDYPFGVYFRNGVEVHTNCVAIARLRRGKVAGIDY